MAREVDTEEMVRWPEAYSFCCGGEKGGVSGPLKGGGWSGGVGVGMEGGDGGWDMIMD